jgi:hypothetical protein
MPSAIAQPTGHGDISHAVVFYLGANIKNFNRKVSRARRYLAATGRGPRQGSSEFFALLNVPQYLTDKQRLSDAVNDVQLATTMQTGLNPLKCRIYIRV